MPRITMNACSFIQLCLSQLRLSCCMFLPRNLKVSGSRLCGKIERRTVYRRFLQEKRYIATNMLPNDSKWYVWNISGQIPLHRVFNCPAPREDHPTRAYTEAEVVNWWVNATIHWIHGSTLCILKQSWILQGLQACLLHDLHFLAKLLAGNRFQAFRLKGSSSPAHLHYWSTG